MNVSLLLIAWSNCAIKPTISSYRVPRNGAGFRDHGDLAAEAWRASPAQLPIRMSWLDQRRQKSVAIGPTTTNAARGRTSRQAHLPQKPQQPRPGGEILDDHGISGGGGCDATSEALPLPGCQPPSALFTPAVSTKPHKTGDLAAGET